MPASTGRTTEPRTVATVGTTSASAALTFPSGAMTAADIGRPITGTGIPAGATLTARPTATTGTLSANATATGSITATLGFEPTTTGAGYGFIGWSPETAAESATYSVLGGASASSPDRLTDAVTRVSQRTR